MKGLSAVNVQAIVSKDTHRILRDIAYNKELALRDLIAAILTDYANKHEGELQLNQQLNVANN